MVEVWLKTSHSSRTPRIIREGYGGRMKGKGGRWRKEEGRVRLKKKVGTEHKLHFELCQMVQGELAGRVQA